MRKIFTFLVWMLLSSPLWAQSEFSSESPSLNRKVRNLGMGNVGVALRGTHDSSPFYNPAGLNDLEKGRLQFFSITGDASKSAISLVKDVINLKDDIDNAADDSAK